MCALWRGGGVLLSSALLPSCAAGQDAQPLELRERSILAALLAMEVVADEDDPLKEHRPETVDCNNLVGWYTENDGLEVDTGHCNYLALRESAASGAPKGSLVSTQISHFDLTAPEPTEAHMAILVGDRVVWQKTVPIPADADVYTLEFGLPVDVHKGDDVGFHLHNHGQNTYLLQILYVSPAPDVDR